MTLKDINSKDIIKNKNINSLFVSTHSEKFNLDCNFLSGNFYLDTFNYFPISLNNNTFSDLFSWEQKDKYANFYNEKFYKDFNEKKNELKLFSNTIILGSSGSDDYYRNIISFLPRLFFIKDKEINLAIHRKSSNSFRVFLIKILDMMDIKLKKFIFLDDDFYSFEKSKIPQFFNKETSLRILKSSLKENENKDRLNIYVSRQNSNSRNLINEADIIEYLKTKNFRIIDTNNMDIQEQIKIFSSAGVVVGPTCSALTNLIFCPQDTKVIELKPNYKFQYEDTFKYRYSEICNFLKLEYNSIEADSIENDFTDKYVKKFIPKKILQESNYYKNLLIKKNDLKEIINKLSI